MGPNRSDSHREEHPNSVHSRHGQQQQQLPPVSTTPVSPQVTAAPAGPPVSALPSLPTTARPASPNSISWLGTCDAAPPSVLSCQKLEASLQLQSMRTIQTAPPPFSTKYDCDGRPLADASNRVNFLNQEGGLSRDFCQFGVDPVPQNYFHRQAPQENHFGHLNQASLEPQVPNFLSQATSETSYQHQQNQLTSDATVLRQQNPSGFSSVPPLYRQSHLSADAPPFCHQAQQSEQSTFQPPVGTPSYLQNHPPVETVMYQHQNQLPIEPPLFQRSGEGPVFHQTTQPGPEPTLYHQNQTNIETSLYHQANQRPGDTSTFRDQHHPVQEGQIFHQTLSAVEAALYRNHHPAESAMFHQQNQTGSEPSLYHSNQQGSDSTVYHRQEAALYHHPTPPPHFVHQNQASGPQAPTFYHQNQAVPEGTSFYRFQNQTGDSHFQRPSQPSAAFYHLQNQTEAQYHQQNSSDSSFHLLQNQRSVESQLQSSGHLEGSFYPHRNVDVVDPQLCQQSHSAAEAQLFQFQNQAAQENQLHHQNRSIAEVPGFSYQGQVTQDTRVHPSNHGPMEMSMANFQNQSAQEAQMRHQSHSEVPVYHYQGQVTPDVQLRQQNPNPTDLSGFNYQNQANQGAQLHHSNVVVTKSSALYHQKSGVGETKIHQNSVLSLTKTPVQNWEAPDRKSLKVVSTEANMPFVNLNGGQFPCLPVNDPRTVLSVIFSSKGSPVVTGQFPQNIPPTEKVNVYRQAGNVPETNFSVQSSKGARFNRDQNLLRDNQNKIDKEKEIEVVSDSEKDIEGIHLDHNRNTLKPNLPHLPSVVDEIKGEEILAEKKEASQDSSAESSQNIQDRSNLYSNGFHTFSSHESTNAREDFSSHKARECIISEQNLNELAENIFDGDKTHNVNQSPNSRPDEGNRSHPENHSPFSPRFEDKRSSFSSDSSDWTSQGHSIAGAAAEVNQNEEHVLGEEDEDASLVNLEENFTVSNVHFLPRPPDILLTLPADVENESEVESTPGVAVQPSTPSNQLSQDGSDELGPALEFLFEKPEEVELPLTPPATPPTPPTSPPLLTPPCSPPLSSAPSSPRSVTPPFSSPLSSSPHVGDGEMQGSPPVNWEPFKLKTQPLIVMEVLEKLSGSEREESEAQDVVDLSSERQDEACLLEGRSNAEFDSLFIEEVRMSSAESNGFQIPTAAPQIDFINANLQNGAASSSNCIVKEENMRPLQDQCSLQLWNPILGSTTWSHHQDEDLPNNSSSPLANLDEQLSTECPLPQLTHQSLPLDQDEECKDGSQMVNVDLSQASEVENSPYFLPIQDEMSVSHTEDVVLPSNSEDTEGVPASPTPAQDNQDSSPSPSSMMVNGFNSPIVHRLKL